jgi:deoxycytidylate deaminase
VLISWIDDSSLVKWSSAFYQTCDLAESRFIVPKCVSPAVIGHRGHIIAVMVSDDVDGCPQVGIIRNE